VPGAAATGPWWPAREARSDKLSKSPSQVSKGAGQVLDTVSLPTPPARLFDSGIRNGAVPCSAQMAVCHQIDSFGTEAIR